MSQKKYLKQKACELIDNQFPDEPLGGYTPLGLHLRITFKDTVHKGLHGSLFLSKPDPWFEPSYLKDQ